VSFTLDSLFGRFLKKPFFKSHIERALYGDPFDGSYNITGPQMVLVMKLTTFAWNVWDGRRPVEVCLFFNSTACRPLTVTRHAYQHAPYAGPRQVADENAHHEIPFIARILRLLVRRTTLLLFL
jgi:hypothetical protein